MLLLRRLSPSLARQWRANSSLATSSSSDTPPDLPTQGRRPYRQDLRGGPGRRIQFDPKPEQNPSTSPEHASSSTSTTTTTTTTHGRRRRRLPTRAPISLENPRAWNRPVARGMIPAYDLALDLLKTDSAHLVKEAEALGVRIAALDKEVVEAKEKELDSADEAELKRKEDMLEEMHAKLDILQVQSAVNLPWERWSVANAMADMSKPVHRHLVEQKWRKDGDLDLLMERLHQMKVIPDVLSDLRPTVDVDVTVRTLPKEFHDTGKVSVRVEPGVFLKPGQTLQPPKIYPTVFHPEERLYTMLLVDPDVPDEANFGFTTYLHWLKPNIPLNATHRTRISWSNEHTPYIPPHPQRGTPYHRYVLLLLPQPPASGLGTYTRTLASRATADTHISKHLDIPEVLPEARLHFDVRAFIKRWELDIVPGGGAHMWREVWDERVSDIYKDVLNAPEPKYGRPKKVDPYAEVKRTKKYIL